MKTGLTRKQIVTEAYYNAKDPIAEGYTHDMDLKKRMGKYAEKCSELYPHRCEHCRGKHIR